MAKKKPKSAIEKNAKTQLRPSFYGGIMQTKDKSGALTCRSMIGIMSLVMFAKENNILYMLIENH